VPYIYEPQMAFCLKEAMIGNIGGQESFYAGSDSFS
jgi:hypothetical protein